MSKIQFEMDQGLLYASGEAKVHRNRGVLSGFLKMNYKIAKHSLDAMKPSFYDHRAGPGMLSSLRKFLASAILLTAVIMATGCSPPSSSVPPVLESTAVVLPATWTPTYADSIEHKPEPSSSPSTPPQVPTEDLAATNEPIESWWVMSFGAGRTFRVRSIFETEDGAFLLWVQEPGVSSKPNRDLVVKIRKDGQLAWQKSVSPMTSAVRNVQALEGGSVMLVGFNEAQGFPFTLHLASNGELLSETTYRGTFTKPEQTLARLPLENRSPSAGRVYFKGKVEGVQYIEDFATLPAGEIVAAGPIYGTTTGAQGGTFSALRGLWAARFNQKGQVLWKKVFETKAGPLFIGAVFSDGSSVMVKDNVNSNSIVKIDPSGNVLYWRHYAIPGRVRSISETPEGGILLVGTSGHILKLDDDGSIVWKRHMPSLDARPQYAFETSNSALLLILESSNHGMMVARLSMDESFPTCDVLDYEQPGIGEHFPLLPANIGASVEITTSLSELDAAEQMVSMTDAAPALLEICRKAQSTSTPTAEAP